VLCSVTVPVAKNSSNSSAAQKQQIEVKQAVEIIPEAGTFGSGKVAGSTAPTVIIANLFANRVSYKRNQGYDWAGSRPGQCHRDGHAPSRTPPSLWSVHMSAANRLAQAT
jgi:hypothetical protein